jgi:hypothetical protein
MSDPSAVIDGQLGQLVVWCSRQLLSAEGGYPVLHHHRRHLRLWVPKTCDTWADALQIAVGSFRVRVPGGQILIRPEVG